MRVIAGKAKGRRLKPVPGHGTRPITDRAKSALFSILGADVIGSSFLDLFAGTGGVGIEALSRGASKAVFVERGGAALRTIRENLAHTLLTAGGRIERADVFVKHFGKCLSVEHWEETCDYYMNGFPASFRQRWETRKGKAIHTHSDFGRRLYTWEELMSREDAWVKI